MGQKKKKKTLYRKMAELKRWRSYLLIFVCLFLVCALCSKTDIQQAERNTKGKNA